MNIRKNIDYSEMYKELDKLMEQQLPQMELYCAIGNAVCQRTEKGAAVMASEYLNKRYPDAKGFSPRNLRRMRDFYRLYENHPALLSLAMQIGWTQNCVIMEAELIMELREWYMKAAQQFAWSKTELIAQIAANAHEDIGFSFDENFCDEEEKCEVVNRTMKKPPNCYKLIKHMNNWIRSQWLLKKDGRRRCTIISIWTIMNHKLLLFDHGSERIRTGISLHLNYRNGKISNKKHSIAI